MTDINTKKNSLSFFSAFSFKTDPETLSTFHDETWKTNNVYILKQIKNYGFELAWKFCTYLH